MAESLKKEDYLSGNSPANAEKIVVLLVEDSETDAYVVQRILEQRMQKSCEFLHAVNMSEAQSVLTIRHDIQVVLLDLGLPDSPGPRATYRNFEKFKERLPIVVLTSMEDRVTALDIIEIGALDYVYKQDILNQPASLPRAIEFAIGRHHSITNNKKKILDDLHQKEDFIQLMSGGYSVMN